MKCVKHQTKLQNDKLKTLCTLDTTDIVLTKDAREIMSRKQIFSTIQKPRTKTRSKSVTRSQISQSMKSKQKQGKYNYNQIIVQTRSIYTDTKPRRSPRKSRQRIRTEYEQSSPKKLTLNNLDIFTTVKNVKFHMDEQYNVDPFNIIYTLKSSKEETIYTVKYLDRTKKSVFYVMKKSNHPKMIEKYEQQIAIKEKLTDLFTAQERKSFSCIYKVYKKDKNEYMYVVYHMEGDSLSWKKPLSQKLIHNLSKNNMQILKHLIVQISKSIHILSSYGYYHSQLRLKNILVELKQDDETVKVSKLVKLSNLSKCHKITNKKSLQYMPHSIYTPPEILNFIMFEKEHKNFNRQWLEYIYRYEEGWRVNVWSLGILVLELLNQAPIQKTFIDLGEILQFQKQIELKFGTLFEKVTDPNLEKILKKMLSINPQSRPSPEQIIVSLTS